MTACKHRPWATTCHHFTELRLSATALSLQADSNVHEHLNIDGRDNCIFSTTIMSGGSYRPPALTIFRAAAEDDDCPPPENREQMAYRIARQSHLIEEFCPDERVRMALLRWADELETYSSLANLFRLDRRTIKNSFIPDGLDLIRSGWVRKIAEVSASAALIEGSVVVCPWIIEAISCSHCHDVVAEEVHPGVSPIAVENFVWDHWELFDGPQNRHLAVIHKAKTNSTRCAILGHRRGAAAIAVPTPVATGKRRAA